MPKIVNDVLRVTERLTGMQALLQISAPYRLAVSFFEEQAIGRGVALTTGIGSSQVDRNSLADMEIAKMKIRQTMRDEDTF